MVLGALAVIGAMVTYDIAKHYIPQVGAPERKFKEKTGLAEIEREHPRAYFAAVTAAEVAVGVGVGKVAGKVAARKAARRGTTVAVTKAAAKKSPKKVRRVSRVYSTTKKGAKGAKVVSAGKGSTKLSVVTKRDGSRKITQYTVRRGTPKTHQLTKTYSSKRISRWTGKKTITTKGGKKVKSTAIRDYGEAFVKSWRGKIKFVGGVAKESARFSAKHPKVVMWSWIVQRGLIRGGYIDPEDWLFDIPLVSKSDLRVLPRS